MVRTVFGLFADPASTQKAVQDLERLGVEADAIHVMTPEPYHEFHFTSDPGVRKTSRDALAGGIIGGVGGAALAAWTAAAVNLPTGGMPIVALGPVGIIAYAGAGLGAVAGAVFRLMRSAGLPDFKGVAYDPALFRELADGGFLLAVLCARDERVQLVKQLLSDAGASPVRERMG